MSMRWRRAHNRSGSRAQGSELGARSQNRAAIASTRQSWRPLWADFGRKDFASTATCANTCEGALAGKERPHRTRCRNGRLHNARMPSITSTNKQPQRTPAAHEHHIPSLEQGPTEQANCRSAAPPAARTIHIRKVPHHELMPQTQHITCHMRWTTRNADGTHPPKKASACQKRHTTSLRLKCLLRPQLEA